MAVVGLTWVLATLLGALPFYFGKVAVGTHVQTTSRTKPPLLYRGGMHPWIVSPSLTPEQIEFVNFVRTAGHEGRTLAEVRAWSLAQGFATNNAEKAAAGLVDVHPLWRDAIDVEADADGTVVLYRLAQRPMSLIDAMFESQSGFSTTGATVISNLEDPRLVPHCLLFWRSSTHFLGGLGIIVLFVAILGHGSAGKALMRAELPGPTQDSSQTRVQHAAWAFAATYVALNLVLTIILRLFDLSWFDATCHAFGTMATGGFSTYNDSLGHFESTAIEMIVVVFMIIAGSNFTLLVLCAPQSSAPAAARCRMANLHGATLHCDRADRSLRPGTRRFWCGARGPPRWRPGVGHLAGFRSRRTRWTVSGRVYHDHNRLRYL